MPVIVIDEDNVYYFKYIKKVISEYLIYLKKGVRNIFIIFG